MKKAEFVTKVAAKLGYTKKQVQETLDAIFEVITEEVESGNDVHFYNFGTFSRRFRAERQGINPSNMGTLTIPAHYLPVFKPGEGFKKQLKDVPVPAK
jgi:DNA-binding protein HU-beta